MEMRKLIIIPAYNEEHNIGMLLDELEKSYGDYDYIVINDCSKDGTKAILKDRHAPFLDLPINLGIGGGVQAGYLYALERNYDIAIQMDGDGQHLPEYLENIVRPIEEGRADAVIGSRFLENEGFQSSAMRRMGIRFLSGLIKLLTGVRICDVTSGFRAVNRKCIMAFAEDYAQDYPEPEALVSTLSKGMRTVEVPVKMKERIGGTSSITGLKTIYYMIKVSFALIIAKVAKKR
jgi:glycosyltransferase involved in cell wall biosynthesis